MSDRIENMELQLYLEVDKIEPQLIWVGGVWHQQRLLEAFDGLAVVRILCRGGEEAAADKRVSLLPILQLHRVQGEPVSCRPRIEPLTHHKTDNQQKK